MHKITRGIAEVVVWERIRSVKNVRIFRLKLFPFFLYLSVLISTPTPFFRHCDFFKEASHKHELCKLNKAR